MSNQINFLLNGKTIAFNSGSIQAKIKQSSFSSDKDKSIFTNLFDKNKDGKLSQSEIDEAFKSLQQAAAQDSDKTNLSNDEATSIINNNQELKNSNVTAEDLFGFLNTAQNIKPEESEETEEKTEQTDKTKWSNYTVQNGQGYKALIIESLKAQGIEEPTNEQIEKEEQAFEEQNPGAVKTNKKGVKYLLVGASVKIRGGLEDKKNSEEQIQAWVETVKGKKSAKTESSGADEVKDAKGTDSETKKGYNPEVGDNSRYHDGFTIAFIRKDGTIIEKDSSGKILVCNKYGEVQTVITKRNGKVVTTVYTRGQGAKRGTAEYTSTYEDGATVERNGVVTGRIHQQKYHITNETVTYKYDTDGSSIVTYQDDDTGDKLYYKYDTSGDQMYQCDEYGNKIP